MVSFRCQGKLVKIIIITSLSTSYSLSNHCCLSNDVLQQAPLLLDGTLAADAGFDPLGLAGKNMNSLYWQREVDSYKIHRLLYPNPLHHLVVFHRLFLIAILCFLIHS